MLNRKYFPFERNSYYYGKLLTAKDFEAEQKYINDKRRFINRLTGANGILAGLGVIMADDASIVLQAGCALDASGREIVVPETKVIKLSTIEGYHQLSSSRAYLGISYDEQPADEDYSAMGAENTPIRYNKVREQYKLILLDEALVPQIPTPEQEFVSRLVIYADQDVEVVQYAPKYIPRGSDTTIHIEIKRLCAGSAEYSFLCNLETPGFKNASGSSSTDIVVNNLKLEYGEKKTVEYTFQPEAYIWGSNSSVAMSITGFVIQRNDDSFTVNQKLETLLKPIDSEIMKFYLSNFYGKSMDKVLGESYDERLWIAGINLIRQNASIIIDQVYPAPFHQYAYNAQQAMTLRALESYYPQIHQQKISVAGTPAFEAVSVHTAGENAESINRTACGVFDFPLGLGYDSKEPLFSEEIMHGLGKGPVYVDVGLEYITADGDEPQSEIVLGDVSIFSSDGLLQSGEERLYHVSKAVKVLPERGTFVVGLRMEKATGLISVRIRWYAFRLGEISKKIQSVRDNQKMIMVNPDTIVLQPKGTAHISPVFINMASEVCIYRLIDPEGGTIDNNGVYTAPSKEGAYEIRVEAISDPQIYTHVFAIVSQKKKD